jgi:hypothetical protein
MKKLAEPVSVVEVPNEGLVALMGKNVLLFCMNYFYAGKLVGVNDKFVQLENAQIVYETGELSASTYKTAQSLPAVWYVQTTAIESYGLSGRQ